MQDATLREVCAKYKVSRRAVQGYEKAGIVKSTGKNKMGYLLYDAATQERIGIIRMYQEIGFSVREIKEIIDAPKISTIPILENQMEKLKKERSRIEEQIEILYDLIQKR
jgi:DNA-binding transcriptional MerR regulator